MKRNIVLIALAGVLSLFVVMTGCQKAPETASSVPETPASATETEAPHHEVMKDQVTSDAKGVEVTEAANAENEPAEEVSKDNGVDAPVNMVCDDTGAKETHIEAPMIIEHIVGKSAVEYLRAKGIDVVAKDNFKEPKLVLDLDVKEQIRFYQNVCAPNENGITAIVVGDTFKNKDQAILYFNKDGKLINRVDVGENECVFSGGSMGAVVMRDDEAKKTATLVFYDELGKEKWRKDIAYTGWIQDVDISYYGNSICFVEGNPDWSIEEWGTGNLNISRVLFLYNNGNEAFEYDKIRNLASGEFSRDGTHYVGLFWWQSGLGAWGKLVNIDLENGIVAWETPYAGNLWEGFDRDEMAVSESGRYVAVLDQEASWRMQEKTKKEAQETYSYKDEPYIVSVYNMQGNKFASVKSKNVYGINDDGMLFIRDVDEYLLVDPIAKLIISTYKNAVPVVDEKTSEIIQSGNNYYRLSFKSFLLSADYNLEAKTYFRIVDIDENICWDPHEKSSSIWSDGGLYLIAIYPYVRIYKIGE